MSQLSNLRTPKEFSTDIKIIGTTPDGLSVIIDGARQDWQETNKANPKRRAK
jgi:hypothetical protein